VVSTTLRIHSWRFLVCLETKPTSSFRFDLCKEVGSRQWLSRTCGNFHGGFLKCLLRAVPVDMNFRFASRARWRLPTEHHLLHRLVDTKLDSNHRDDRYQTRRKPAIKGPNSFLFRHSHCAIDDSLVGCTNNNLCAHLSDKPRFDGIDWDHDANGRCAGHASHDRVLNVFCWPVRNNIPYSFQLLEKCPCQSLVENKNVRD